MNVVVNNGITYINTTPHSIKLRNTAGEDFIVEPSGIKLNAAVVEEKITGHSKVELVQAKFKGTEEGNNILAEIFKTHGDAVVIGSIIAAQAYPGAVLGMIAVPGLERVPAEQKVMRADKFTVF